MLTHFVPTRFDRPKLLATVRRDIAGPLIIGEDLMTFDTENRSIRHGSGLLTLGR